MRTFNNVDAVNAYRFITFDNENVKMAASSKDKISGISDSVNSPENDIVDIYEIGEVCEIEAGSAFSAGDELTSDSEGRAIKAASGDNIGAIAYQNASAAGDIAKVIVVIGRTIGNESKTEE